MRRIILIVSALAVLTLTACATSSPQAPAPTLGVAQPPATLVPTTAPTETSAPIPTLVQPTETLPPPAATATNLPPPTATKEATSLATATMAGNGVLTFQSVALGVRFQYLASQDGQQFAVLEQGDKDYVYAVGTPPLQGQYVQVFHKPASQSLIDGIRTQVLNGYSLTDCVPTLAQNPNGGTTAPSTYTFAQIRPNYPANATPEQMYAAAAKCPQPYAAVGGLAYFLADSAHPDRFLFFSIGQYYIPGGPNNIPWQATIQLWDPSGSGGQTQPTYIDDRSTPQSLMTSYVSALNLHQYVRAYSYWENGAEGLQPFPQFQQGYANTKSVQLTIGNVSAGAAAGNLYWAIPVYMVSTLTDGSQQTFSGCYEAHQGQPANFGAPPFIPMGVRRAHVVQVANGSQAGPLLASVCVNAGFAQAPGTPASPTPPTTDISADRYLDDRSDPVLTLRSLFNAINRHEYARAYYYWEPNSTQLQPFNQFAAGYANTASVQLATGTVRPDAGAGNFYYSVPVTLIAKTTGGATQTFVGCYVLHLSSPDAQGVPPFRPLGVRSATVRQVANNADTNALMATACNP